MKKIKAKSKISTKYQIVIPKELRMVLKDASPGTLVYLEVESPDTVKIKLESKPWTEQARGIVKRGTYGKDPINFLRKIREEFEGSNV